MALPQNSLQLRLQARASSVGLLRERLRLWLDELGVAGEDGFDVSLAVTEAFENAVEHPNQPSLRVVDIEGSCQDDTLTIVIRNHVSWQQQAEREDGGYGFPLMRERMDAVNINSQPERTSITPQRQLARNRNGGP
jgi:anti-sigma regulatory factor (Ser/Thr protein kinase)